MAKQKGNKKKLKWWGWFLIAISIAIVCSGTSVMAWALTYDGGSEKLNIVANPYGFEGLGVKPAADEKIHYFDNLSEDNVIAAVAAAYANACINNKNSDYLTAYDECASCFNIAGTDNSIAIRNVLMKTQEAYCRTEYHIADSVPFVDKMGRILGGADKLNELVKMMTAEKIYTDSTMSIAEYSKVYNSSVLENGVPYADWSIVKENDQRALPAYNNSQDGSLAVTSHLINDNTITSASVEYQQEQGYYTVNIVIDTTTACTVSNTEVVAGTGDKNARYTKLELEITIWDNGYFRTVGIEEEWSAKVMSDFTSTFSHLWEFSYQACDADVQAYNQLNS